MAELLATASVPQHQVRGACPHDCPDTCSLVTTVENGVAVRVGGNPEHRHTDGVLCTKVSRYTERTYHPERLLQPLRRAGPKGAGKFEPITWDEALDDIGQRARARGSSAGVPSGFSFTTLPRCALRSCASWRGSG